MPRNPAEGKTVESSRRTGGRKDEEKKKFNSNKCVS